MSTPNTPPTKYGVALFHGFQALDVFGPLDVLNRLAKTEPLELALLSQTLDPVSTALDPSAAGFGQKLVPTHTYQSAPDIEVLIVPGGLGTRGLEETQHVVDYVKSVYPTLRYLLTVCTGSALVARTGILDGRAATSNKRAFAWAKTQGPGVRWVREARWVTDGNIWTSSGIAAGIDMICAFLADQYSEEVADELADGSEYERSRDPKRDPFARFAPED